MTLQIQALNCQVPILGIIKPENSEHNRKQKNQPDNCETFIINSLSCDVLYVFIM